MNPQDRPVCPDCDLTINRRTFIRTVGSAALVGAAAPALLARFAHAAPSSKSTAETAVVRFYNSLSENQKKTIVFPIDHELRQKINANWHITTIKIDDDFYSKDQRAMIDEIIKVNSQAAIETSRALARNEGIAGGISSGAAIAAALEIGKRPESVGKTILAIVPSFSERYLSTALFEGI